MNGGGAPPEPARKSPREPPPLPPRLLSATRWRGWLMRAVIGSRHGGPEVLQIGEVAPPEPGPGQLLVDVAAAGVNYMDIYQREGRPPYASAALPYVPGTEGAGTGTAVGPR